MRKVLYIYWAQGFINAPKIVKKCLLTWKLKNPTWDIVKLNDKNLINYIDISKEIPDIKQKNITRTAYSDIVRIFLLEKYGGCWCDATLFCQQPLDTWLDKYIKTGFFGFNKPGKNRMLSSWFLYSEKNNYIVEKWKQDTILYWKENSEMKNYFWFHFLFNELYLNDNTFKKLWDLTPKISADGPHFLQNKGLLGKARDIVKNHIDQKKTPLYKLTYKFNIKKFNKNCNLAYLYRSI